MGDATVVTDLVRVPIRARRSDIHDREGFDLALRP
jgi:hypothetical protein